MHHGKSIASTLLAPHSELTSLLDTLPDALIFLDKNATILYANASAATMVGAKQHELPGHTLWQSAPPLVTPALYQAVITATHTRKPLQVTYRSPSTRTRLRVHLSPTSQGVALFFSEETEPAQLQDLLGQSEQRYQDLLESTSDRVTILTPDGLILDANQRCLADAQARRETVVGRPFTDFPLWSSVPTVQQQVRSAIAQASRGDTAHCEVRILPQPGRSLDLALTITPHRGANQAVEYLICAAQDITARKQAEADQHVLVEAIPHFVWIMRPDGSSEYSNQRWCDYTNTTTEQLQGNGWIQSLLHPDERQHVLEVWQNSVRTGAPYKIEHRIRDGKTGTYRWFLAQGIPYRDAQGTILRWFGTCTDIDEQKQAEERIRASEQKLRVLAETVPQLVWTTLADGRLDYANQRYLDFIHTDFEHLRDYRWRQFVHPEDAERTLAVRQHSLDTGEPYEIEYRFRDGRTGTYRWLLTRALPLRDESGQITKWFGTGTDIDEQKRTEHALRESQQRTHTLMESNIIGIFVAEGDEIVEANDAFLRMTGYSREDLQQSRLNWVHMTPPEYVVLNQQIHQKLKIHQSVPSHEKEYICKDGSRLPVLVGGVTLPFNPRQSICFVLDNSARKELEQRKDDFLSMVSHELNTPLASLKLQTQLLRKQLARQGIHTPDVALSRMEALLNVLANLVAELLDLSKIQAGKLEYAREMVNLNELLREIAEESQQIQATHTIVVHYAEYPPLLVGDRNRLKHAVLNLVNNAIKYSPQANMVEVNIRTSAEEVTLSVRDQGIGIPREQREKIFDRFYRAVAPRQCAFPGLGMGLYIVSEIVKHHQGTITVESEKGKGSTFYVTLPCGKGYEESVC